MHRKPKFELVEAKDGWRWHLVAGNGRIVASGEAHGSKSDALRAIRTVRSLAFAASIPCQKVEVIDLSGITPSTRLN